MNIHEQDRQGSYSCPRNKIKGKGYLASSRQYGNALLGVRHQEEEEETKYK